MNCTARFLILAGLAMCPFLLNAEPAKAEKTPGGKAATTAAKAEPSPTQEDMSAKFRNRTPPPQPAESAPKSNKGSIQPVLKGEDMHGEGFAPPQIEANGIQLLQHYGAITGNVVIASSASAARIDLKPRPEKDSFPVVTVFMERIDGGKYLRIPLVTDFELKDSGEIKKEADIPRGTYRVTVGFYKSSKADRTQLEVHGIKFESAPDTATDAK